MNNIDKSKQIIHAAGTTVELNDKGELVRAKAHGNVIETQEDGGYFVTQANGNKIKVAADGSVNFDTPKSIGVRDLSKLASYTISESIDGVVHHSIKFLNGGFVNVMYANGQLASCQGNNVTTSLSNDAEMLFDQNDTPK